MRPTDRRQPSLPRALPPGVLRPGVLPPSRARARAAALTLHSGARGSCSLLPPPAPAAALALPGQAPDAGGREGGWRRSGPRAGTSWRRRPGPARSARFSSARRPSLPSCRRRRRRARLARLCWLRSGGRGRGAEQGACLRTAPRTAPPPPPPPEARPAAAAVCPRICRSLVLPPLATMGLQPPTEGVPFVAVSGRSTAPMSPPSPLGKRRPRALGAGGPRGPGARKDRANLGPGVWGAPGSLPGGSHI